jgi:hypothetical protein
MIRFSNFFRGLQMGSFGASGGCRTEVLVAHEEVLEVEMDQIKAILSVTNITPNGMHRIEYNSGKMTFPSEPSLTPPIFNFIIR